jgi:hypothetical protein
LTRLGETSLVAVIVGLCCLAVADAGGDSQPTISAQQSSQAYAGAYVPFTGYGFVPFMRVRVEMLSPALQLLGVVFLYADESGFIQGSVAENSVPCFGGGKVILAADGLPGPTAWAASDVAPTVCLTLRFVLANFDTSGVVLDGGGSVLVSGPIRCALGDKVNLHATVTERLTGAVAVGSWSKSCAGKPQHWRLTARITDGVRLRPGCAHGTGLAIVTLHGKAVGALQWSSRPLTLRPAVLTNTAAPRASC